MVRKVGGVRNQEPRSMEHHEQSIKARGGVGSSCFMFMGWNISDLPSVPTCRVLDLKMTHLGKGAHPLQGSAQALCLYTGPTR